MRPVEIGPVDRPTYHAAASIASNFLITLEAAAERLAASVGIERDLLVPLVARRSENWARVGPERLSRAQWRAATRRTVTAQRDAVATAAPTCSICSTRWSPPLGRGLACPRR